MGHRTACAYHGAPHRQSARKARLARSLPTHRGHPTALCHPPLLSSALLSAAEKRRRFVAGEIDAAGQERPRGPFFRVNYVSELDALGWRTGLLDLLRAPEADCACAWGRYVPRTGFVAHQSEVMAAHLQALRGGRVASSPFGRIVLSPYPFEPRTGHYIQRVSPAGPGCVRIGEPDVRGLEAGALSPHGAYLFVHFGLFEECRRCLEPRVVGPRGA